MLPKIIVSTCDYLSARCEIVEKWKKNPQVWGCLMSYSRRGAGLLVSRGHPQEGDPPRERVSQTDPSKWVNWSYERVLTCFLGGRDGGMFILQTCTPLPKFHILIKDVLKKNLSWFLAHPVRRTRWAYAMVWRPSSVRPSVRPQFSKCFFFVISQPIFILIVS